MKIIINNCNDLEQALHIRKQYALLCPNSQEITIDMSCMEKNTSQELLIGVLINIKRYFSIESKISISNPPPHVHDLLNICRLESMFEFI